MIRSMTAYARVDATSKEDPWSVEIRSLNHRYCELSLKVPPCLYPLENRIREIVQEKMRRGKISLTISPMQAEEKNESMALDFQAVEFYLASLETIKAKYHLEGNLSVRDLIGLPRIFTPDKSAKEPEKCWKSLEKVLRQALKATIAAKEKEGEILARDMQERLDEIGRAVKRIEKNAAGNADRYRKRLTEKLERLIGEKSLDRDRLHLEVAFLAERSDITEEIVRLKSHLTLFAERLQQSAEVGRELDFLCQEIHREVNTLSAKSPLFEISTDVVLVKRELEKIREQVQNIE